MQQAERGCTLRSRTLDGNSATSDARLLPVRRFLAILLLAMLPIQFSWAAVVTDRHIGGCTGCRAERFSKATG